MPLSSGTTLGPYQIEAPLGAGGMGEVYRARDTRLDRTVAIKVLPEHVADDPDLKQRFEREAKTVAALSHPHICPVFDVGEQDGINFLVMEYLEGETLAQRLEKGALPLDQALTVAIEIADALDKAHRQGIVHRDLKPGNIMLTKAGAKLLDFGLAKLQPVRQAGGLSALPTQGAPLTQEGSILGTFQYMAPEQLEGQEADHRTDIFAFGAVVYEMVTGKRAFEGKSQASLIAAILEREPFAMSSLQAMSPQALDRTVMKCLAKDPEARWQSACDLADELKWVAEGGGKSVTPAGPYPRRSGGRVWMLVAAVTSALAVGVSLLYVTRPAPDATKVLIEVPVAAEIGLAIPALSPDGRHVAFAASFGGEGILVRSVDTVEPRLLPGTEGASRPFWSPDSRQIGFWSLTEGTLQAIALSGGPVRTLCDPADISWATWNGAGVVLFSSGGELFRCSESGSGPTPVTALGESQDGLQPQFLPDGEHFLFVRTSGPDGPGVYAGSLDSTDATFVVRSAYKTQYAPPGYLLFVRDEALMAQPFDVDTLQLAAEAVVVAPDVGTFRSLGAALFSASDTGDLAYGAGGSYETSQFAWVDRAGNLVESIGTPGEYDNFAVSPDENQLVVEIPDPTTGTADLWILDVTSGGRQRFTFDPADDRLPIWSSDGQSIIFSSARGGGPLQLWQKPIGGVGEAVLVLETDENAVPISSSGERLVFSFGENRAAGGSGEVGVLAQSGDSEAVRTPLTPDGFAAYHHDLSPDGRWIAYISDESGQPEMWVQPFPPSGGRRQVSEGGRWQPKWSADGTELFSLDGGGVGIDIVGVDTDGERFATRPARTLFQSPNFTIKASTTITTRSYYVSKDGNRLLLNAQTRLLPTEAEPIVWVLNWTAELEQ